MSNSLSRFGRVQAIGSMLMVLSGTLLGVSVARASGPTERLQQPLPHPTDPTKLTVRFGLASQGYVFSNDGGKTFRTMCSQSVAPEAQGADKVKRISTRTIAATAATTIDAEGRVLFSMFGSLYSSNDDSGCGWTRVPDFDGRWAFGLQADPGTPSIVWAAVSTTSGDGLTTKLELMRRDAAGAWASVGEIGKVPVGQFVLDGNMVVSSFEGKTRLYVTANVGGGDGYLSHVYVSNDEGKTFGDYTQAPEFESMFLLGVDPGNPDNVIAAASRDAMPDGVFISKDAGKTFSVYGGKSTPTEIRAISGVTFDKQGRLLISDAGDGIDDDDVGGLFIAEKFGDPLEHVEGTEFLDCVKHDPLTDRLYLCSYDRFGVANPNTYAFEELVSVEKVAGIIECPGRDMVAACKDQFNEGPAWCCTGHFPFTPFCGAYDVTRTPDGRRVFCGLAAREYDRPGSTQDAGVGGPLMSEDASGLTSEPTVRPSAPRTDSGGGGCSLAASETSSASWSGLLVGLSLALVTFRRLRKRT